MPHKDDSADPWKRTIVIAAAHVIEMWFEEVQWFSRSELET
jgi:hypothetical protein